MANYIQQAKNWFYRKLDAFYLSEDKRRICRTKNLDLIPTADFRVGGKTAYGEWCHVVGIFQTLLFVHLRRSANNRILDVGCGTGIMGIASQPFTKEGGFYCGMDVDFNHIKFCRKHYAQENFGFKHIDFHNEVYAPYQQNDVKPKWDVANRSFHAVTALSVWTHLQEADARFYFKEIDRVLKVGGVAMITFFLLDEEYEKSVSQREKGPGKYHKRWQTEWIFDRRCKGSQDWLYSRWAKKESAAIAITNEGLQSLIAETNLTLEKKYIGNWKETPGVFFQDVLIFRKQA